MPIDTFVILFICLIVLIYGFALSRIIPSKFHFVSNSMFTILQLLIANLLELDVNELGISLSYIASGFLVALASSAFVLVFALGLASLPKLESYFLSQSSILKSSPSRLSYETLFRIPLTTALFEEFVFRGFLLAIFMTNYSTAWALVASSCIFGLWHVFPAINGMNKGHYQRVESRDKKNKYSFVVLNVGMTAIAGVFFGWLRIISGSILAPWILHWTINAGGVVAVLFAKQQSNRST